MSSRPSRISRSLSRGRGFRSTSPGRSRRTSRGSFASASSASCWSTRTPARRSACTQRRRVSRRGGGPTRESTCAASRPGSRERTSTPSPSRSSTLRSRRSSARGSRRLSVHRAAPGCRWSRRSASSACSCSRRSTRSATFEAEELSLLQAVAAEAALAFERLRSAAALAEALEREQRAAEIVRRLRAELDPDDVVRVAREELATTLALDAITIDVAGDEAKVDVQRADPLTDNERTLVETVRYEIGAAVRTAALLADHSRQARVQRGFYRIASLLGEPVSPVEAYDAAAQAAAEALGGDFAAVLAAGAGGLVIVGGHELRPEVRELPIPQAFADAAEDDQLLAAPTSRATAASATPGSTRRSARCSPSPCAASSRSSCSCSSTRCTRSRPTTSSSPGRSPAPRGERSSAAASSMPSERHAPCPNSLPGRAACSRRSSTPSRSSTRSSPTRWSCCAPTPPRSRRSTNATSSSRLPPETEPKMQSAPVHRPKQVRRETSSGRAPRRRTRTRRRTTACAKETCSSPRATPRISACLYPLPTEGSTVFCPCMRGRRASGVKRKCRRSSHSQRTRPPR